MWLWLLLLPVSLAVPVGHNLSVGQVFTLTLSSRTTVTAPLDKTLPDWISYSNGVLTAVPTVKDVGSLSLQVLFPYLPFTLSIPVEIPGKSGEYSNSDCLRG